MYIQFLTDSPKWGIIQIARLGVLDELRGFEAAVFLSRSNRPQMTESEAPSDSTKVL